MSCHLTKFSAICQGFKNYVFPSETFEELAKVRAKICAECPHMEERMEFKVLDLVKALSQNSEIIPTKEIIHGAGCKLCKCFLPAKTRQLFESCPDNRWE